MVSLKTVFGGAFGLPPARSRGRKVPGATRSQYRSLDFTTWATEKLVDTYRIQEFVHACVNIRARHAASVPWRVSEFTDNEAKAYFEWERKGISPSDMKFFIKDAHQPKRRFVRYNGFQPIFEKKTHMRFKPNDPAEQILEEPNPFYTRNRFIERTIQHKLLTGNAFWVILRAKVLGFPGYKTPFELWPLFPQAVEIDARGQVPQMYNYFPEGRGANQENEGHYVPEDVIHYSFVDPAEPIWGMSPLQAATRTVQTDLQAQKFQLNSMANRGISDLVISPEEKLSAQDFQRGRRALKDHFLGPENARAPFLSNVGVKLDRTGLTSAEVDFIKTRNMDRQSICTIYNIYPPVIAVMEGFGITAIEAIFKHHWTQTVIPDLEDLMAPVNKYLLSQFGDTRFAWYDTSNVDALNESLLERMRTAKIPWTMGIPAAEVNNRLELGMNLDEVVGADEGILPSGAILVRDLVEGNLNGSEAGDGNIDTAPDGGDPGAEPGDPTDPNEPNPGDPADTGEPAEAAGITGHFANGHADPHEGRTRWDSVAIERLCARYGVVAEGEGTEAADHFDYWVVEIPQEIRNLAADPLSGIEISEFDAGTVLRFYHGQSTEERRRRIIERFRNLGYDIPA